MGVGARPRYPGAQPFADDDLSRKLFRGREREATLLTNQILANRLVVLFARSGVGKTSVLNAGVAENLRAEGLLPLTVRVNNIALGSLESHSPMRTDVSRSLRNSPQFAGVSAGSCGRAA